MPLAIQRVYINPRSINLLEEPFEVTPPSSRSALRETLEGDVMALFRNALAGQYEAALLDEERDLTQEERETVSDLVEHSNSDPYAEQLLSGVHCYRDVKYLKKGCRLGALIIACSLLFALTMNVISPGTALAHTSLCQMAVVLPVGIILGGGCGYRLYKPLSDEDKGVLCESAYSDVRAKWVTIKLREIGDQIATLKPQGIRFANNDIQLPSHSSMATFAAALEKTLSSVFKRKLAEKYKAELELKLAEQEIKNVSDAAKNLKVKELVSSSHSRDYISTQLLSKVKVYHQAKYLKGGLEFGATVLACSLLFALVISSFHPGTALAHTSLCQMGVALPVGAILIGVCAYLQYRDLPERQAEVLLTNVNNSLRNTLL